MQGNLKVFGFMATVCFLCAILVSGAATGLRSFQEENQKVDIQRNILRVMELTEPGQELSNEQVKTLYAEKVKCIVINSRGEVIDDDADPTTINLDEQRKAVQEIAIRQRRIQELQNVGGQQGAVTTMQAAVDEVEKTLAFPIFVTPRTPPYDCYCIPISGKGLWSTLYGYFALESDANTVRGITFYKHGETPGLGGEIENPNWQAQFKGKKILENNEFTSIRVYKAEAPEGSEHGVDGISGATITSRSVEVLLREDLERYRPYFEKIWEQKGS